MSTCKECTHYTPTAIREEEWLDAKVEEEVGTCDLPTFAARSGQVVTRARYEACLGFTQRTDPCKLNF